MCMLQHTNTYHGISIFGQRWKNADIEKVQGDERLQVFRQSNGGLIFCYNITGHADC